MAAYHDLAAMAGCTDADEDGFYAETICSPQPDCNDADATIYPGAPEIKHDGTDQDGNGYDLSIEIVSAVYRSDTDELAVTATSALR